MPEHYGEHENVMLEGELPPSISIEAQTELIAELKHHYDTFMSAINKHHRNIEEWHRLYEAIPRRKVKKFPWPGASNFQVHLISSTLNALHARLVKSVQVDPVYLVEPRTEAAAAGLDKKVEEYMDYWVDQMGLGRSLDKLFLLMLIEGTGILRLDWLMRKGRVPDLMVPQASGDVPLESQEYIEYSGPQVTPVPLKNFLLIPADAPEIKDAVYVGHRVWRTEQQLRDLATQGVYFNVGRLLEGPDGGTPPERAPRSTAGRVVTPESGRDSRYKKASSYELVELYGKYDFGDGEVPALITFNPDRKILLRLEPYPYDFGRAPYVDFCVYPRPNFFWGRSVPEILSSSQRELTAFHNMRADAIAKRISPPILVDQSSGVDPNRHKWRPGALIRVNGVESMRELQLQDVPSSLFGHTQDIRADAERAMGVSDYNLGISPTSQRTATEVNRVVSEGYVQNDVLVARLQYSMRDLAWGIWWLLYQYRPDNDVYSITMDVPEAQADPMAQMGQGQMDPMGQGGGAQNPVPVSQVIQKIEMRPYPDTSRKPFEFVPQGQVSEATRQDRQQTLLFLLGQAAGFLQQYNPDGIRHLLLEVLASYDIKDRNLIVGPPWQAMQQLIAQAQQQGMEAGYQEGMKAAAAEQRQLGNGGR